MRTESAIASAGRGTAEAGPPLPARERQSGIEALRLLSMFFVLALHVNVFAFGYPAAADFRNDAVRSLLRVFFEGVAIVGIDCFVLISGWFGIRPKASRVLELLFQCAFFCCVLYAAGWIVGVEFDRVEALKNLFFLGKLNWFIKSYLALYLLSPVLEPFAATAPERTYRRVLVAFFLFQSVYGWLFPVAFFFSNGYSAFSFIGLYLLARYVRRFLPRFARRSAAFDLVVYLALVAATSAAFVLKAFLRPGWPVNLFAYSSPLVVAAALFLFLAFSKSGIRSSFVNAVARSSYAVYLFHVHPCVCAPVLVAAAKRIVERPIPSIAVRMPALLLSFFAAAILLDQVRIAAWRGVVSLARVRKRAERGDGR